MKSRLTLIKSPIRKKNTEHIPLQVYNTEQLETRVSVRISWENFNANRFFFGFLQINIRYTSLRSDLLEKFQR